MLFFFLKKESIYHKIQYSKVMKFDVSAALFGVIAGAIVVYFSISSLGSGSADISELSILFWYIYLVYITLSLVFFDLSKNTSKSICKRIFLFSVITLFKTTIFFLKNVLTIVIAGIFKKKNK